MDRPNARQFTCPLDKLGRHVWSQHLKCLRCGLGLTKLGLTVSNDIGNDIEVETVRCLNDIVVHNDPIYT